MSKEKPIGDKPKVVKPIVADRAEVTPLKDWQIHQNKHHIFLKKGKTATVPAHFIPALKTEKVI